MDIYSLRKIDEIWMALESHKNVAGKSRDILVHLLFLDLVMLETTVHKGLRFGNVIGKL